MSPKTLLTTLLLALTSITTTTAAPTIHDDNSVTFTIKAPSAKSVQLAGEVVPKNTPLTREGHQWKVWRHYLQDFLPQLFQ